MAGITGALEMKCEIIVTQTLLFFLFLQNHANCPPHDGGGFQDIQGWVLKRYDYHRYLMAPATCAPKSCQGPLYSFTDATEIQKRYRRLHMNTCALSSQITSSQGVCMAFDRNRVGHVRKAEKGSSMRTYGSHGFSSLIDGSAKHIITTFALSVRPPVPL